MAGLSTADSSLVTMTGLSDTNQLNFEESLKDFTVVDPSEDIELMNFGDVGNIEPNHCLKDEFFHTSNPNLGMDVNTLDSSSNLRQESNIFVSNSLADSMNELESKLSSTNVVPAQNELRPNILLVTEAKPLNALSLLAMNYDNDDCDLEYPSPTLSDNMSDAKPLSVEEANIIKPVEPDSTTTIVALVENTAPTDFLDIDTLPETLNDLENSSDIPLDELGVEDSTLDSVLNPMLESLPSEIPTDLPIASLATSIHEPLLENFDRSSNVSATSLSSLPCNLDPASCLEPLDMNKILIHPESTEIGNPDTESEVEIVKNPVSSEETAEKPSMLEAKDQPILDDIVVEPIGSNDEVKGQAAESKDNLTEVTRSSIWEHVSSTTEVEVQPMQESTVSQPIYSTQHEKDLHVPDNSVLRRIGCSIEAKAQPISESVSTTKEDQIQPLSINLLLVNTSKSSKITEFRPEPILPHNEDNVSPIEKVKVQPDSIFPTNEGAAFLAEEFQIQSEPILPTNEAEAYPPEVVKMQSLLDISIQEQVSSTVGVNLLPVQDISLPEQASSTVDVNLPSVQDVSLQEAISSTHEISVQLMPHKVIQEVSESSSSTDEVKVHVKTEKYFDRVSQIVDQYQTLPDKPVLPEIFLTEVIKTPLNSAPKKENITDEVKVQLISDVAVLQPTFLTKEEDLFQEGISNKEDQFKILSENPVPDLTLKAEEVRFQQETAFEDKAAHQKWPETIAIKVGVSKTKDITSQKNKEVKVQSEPIPSIIKDPSLVQDTDNLKETRTEKLDKINEKTVLKSTTPESPNKLSIIKIGPSSPSKKTVIESQGVIPTIKITSSGISVVHTKPSPVLQISKPTALPNPIEELIVQKPSTESLTPTRIIIRPLPPFNPSEVMPVRSVKPLILKHSKDPIPRLVIKPVSATRPVASVETLPSRSDTTQPAPSKISQPTKSTETLSVPSIKIITKPGEAHSIVKRPCDTELDSQLTIKRSHLESALMKEVASTAFQIQTETKCQSSKFEKVETTRTKTAVSPIIINLESRDVPSTESILDLEPEEDEPPVIAKTIHQSEPMDFDGDIYVEDDASLMNEVSLPASLCENDDFSFIKPKSADIIDDIDGKSGTVPFIEEDTQSSWSLDPNKLPKLKEIETANKVIDEGSRGSVSSKKSVDDANILSSAASGIYEYHWPVEKGEFYILQEHLCEFLGVKSFKRKHPDLPRRNVELDERQYLRESNAVSETQCDLGLTALRSEDVMELMSKDYPEKYQEYIRAIQEKQRLALEKKTKEYVAATTDKNKMKELLRKAMKSASEYNAHLNQERRDERKMSFDLQTYTIHVPASKKRKLDPEITKVGKFPVALIPGQYQDYYRQFTPNELKYLPINSVVYGPLQELNSINVSPGSDGSQSESDSDSDGSCCSSSFGTQGSGDSSSGSDTNTTNNNKVSEVFFKPKEVQSSCKICHGSQEQNKHAQPEELIHCSQCKTSAHPSCLELPAELVQVIKTYDWLCMDCKTCITCGDPYDEEKLMFCDKCDRGFHTFCVGLRDLPKGRWICQLCGKCAICGSKTPGPEGTKLQWQLAAGEGNKKPQLLCVACSKKKAK